MTTSPFILRSPKAPVAQPALMLGTDLPKQIDGQPVDYKWLDLIQVGEKYVHPKTGQLIDASEQRVGTWLSSFEKMKAVGEKVYAPVDHSTKAADNRGYVLDLRVKDGWLQGMHQLIGDDAIKLASRTERSIYIQPGFRDSKGNVYEEAIVHSSFVSDPVVTGQREPIAASREGLPDGTPIYLCAGSTPIMNGFDKLWSFINAAENLASLRRTLGIPDDQPITEQNILEKLAEYIQKLQAANTAALSANASLEQLQQQLATAQAKATEAEQRAVTLSASMPKLLDADLLEDYAEIDEAGLELCVSQGAITPAVRDKLKPALLGVQGKRNGIALSRMADGSPRLAKLIIDALKDNKPVALGAATGAQVLSRQVPGEEPKPKDSNPLLATAEAMYGKK